MAEYNLLKIKSDSGKLYVFDALTNNIFLIEDNETFNSICMADFGHDSDLRTQALELSNISTEVESNAKTLILEITENCNLRCSYCVFDEQYAFERNHNNKTMPLELAHKTIQDFYNRTDKSEGYIIFYGGEPLIAFESIQSIVNYANEISNHGLKFSLVTNGLAFAEDKFDFFIKHNFLITISLDGDKEIHDKRRITKNGTGTFDIIFQNLQKLKLYNEIYFKNNIRVNCVIHHIDEIASINDFFARNDFPKESLRFSAVLQNNIFIDDYIMQAAFLGLQKTLASQSLIVENYFLDSVLKKIECRRLDEEAHLSKKLCVPFANRTYVRTDGTVQFCERIENYGKLKNSVNITLESESIYTEFKAFRQEECSKCFAYNFCEMCPASFIKNGQLNDELANIKCNQYRKTIEQALQFYINQMERKSEQC